MAITENEKGWVTINIKLHGVTPDMIDWWWVNMEKGFVLWHPEDHKGFEWEVPPGVDSHIGAIQIAPQSHGGEALRRPRIRWDDPATLTSDIVDIVVYDHLLVGASINPEGKVQAYRIHQYEAVDYGTRMRSAAISLVPWPREAGMAWGKHCTSEMGAFPRFLPELYKMWQVVKDPTINRQCCLKIKKEGSTIKYVK